MIILKSEITSVSQFKIVLHYHCKDMFESKILLQILKIMIMNDDSVSIYHILRWFRITKIDT